LAYATTSNLLKNNNRSVNQMIANQAASLVKTGLPSYEDSLDQLAGLVAENLQDKKNMQEIEAEIRAVQT